MWIIRITVSFCTLSYGYSYINTFAHVYIYICRSDIIFSKCIQCNFFDVSEIQRDMEDILVITFQLINYESSRSSSAIKFVCNGYLTPGKLLQK